MTIDDKLINKRVPLFIHDQTMSLRRVEKEKLLGPHNKVAQCFNYFQKYRSSHLRCSIKSYSFKTFAILTGRARKHLCWSLFLIQNITKFLGAHILKNIYERLLLKMCLFMKLKKVKNYSYGVLALHLKNRFFQHHQKRVKMFVFIS